MVDPNDPNDPEPTPEPTESPAPAPQIDLDQAYDVIARTEGWDPRLTKYEIQEHKRRVQEFEREKKEWEQQQRSRSYEQQDDNGDPYMRRISSLERVIMEEREERKREREEQDRINHVANELRSVFIAQARQSGMTQEQMQSREEEFYELVTDMYPSPKMIQEIGAERVARNVFRSLPTNGTRPVTGLNRINPRERVVIPSPQSGPGPGPPSAFDAASQRENETQEQYLERLTRIVREANAGLMSLPEGRKFSSG